MTRDIFLDADGHAYVYACNNGFGVARPVKINLTKNVFDRKIVYISVRESHKQKIHGLCKGARATHTDVIDFESGAYDIVVTQIGRV